MAKKEKKIKKNNKVPMKIVGRTYLNEFDISEIVPYLLRLKDKTS